MLLHTESALISAAYYAALMLELQPTQINLNGIGILRIMQVKSQSGLVVVESFFCSSAAAERVFSLLANSLQQTHALEDYIETSVINVYIV